LGFGIQELFVVCFILSSILCVLAVFDILRSEFTGYNKLVWLLAVVFFPLIGTLAYFIFGRKQKVS